MTRGKFNQDYGIGEIKVAAKAKHGSRKERKDQFGKATELLRINYYTLYKSPVLVAAFNFRA